MCAVRSLFSLFIVTLMGGCVSVPDLPGNHRVLVSEVVERVQCEIHDAVLSAQGQFNQLENWSGKFTLSLKVEIQRDASGDALFTVPTHYGTFKLGIESGLTRIETRTASLDFTLDRLGDVRDYPCPLPPASRHHQIRQFSGELGLREWLDRIVAARRSTAANKSTLPSGVGYTVEFEILATGAVKPSFEIRPASGRFVDLNFSVSGKRDNTNTLEIALSPPAQRALGYTRVCEVVRLDEKKNPVCAFEDTPAVKKRIRELAPPRGPDPATEQRLDQILQQQRLRNLKIQVR